MQLQAPTLHTPGSGLPLHWYVTFTAHTAFFFNA